MATKKKAAAAKPPTRKASSSRAAPSSGQLAAEMQVSQKIQVLVVVFTILSIVFACVTYWRYG